MMKQVKQLFMAVLLMALLLQGIGPLFALPAAKAYPGEAGKALLIVGSASSLTGTDRALRSRLVELGYAVTEGDSSAVAAADLAGAKLAVVSTTATRITAAVKQAAVPLIVFKSSLYPGAGFTGNVKDTDYGTVSTDNTVSMSVYSQGHPLAAGLDGSVEIQAAATNIGWGKPRGNPVIIAATAGDETRAALFAYDQGEAMAGGFSAPARRVALPWGSSLLTATESGWLLFDAAAAWATELSPSSARNITAFAIDGQIGQALIDSAEATVVFTMPSGTDVTGLRPSIQTSPLAAVSPSSGAAVDFSDETVWYTVTAEDGSTREWSVRVLFQLAEGNRVELIRNGQLLDVYPAIQAAVDAAGPGDIIRIGEGEYFENVVVNGVSGLPEAPIVIEPAPGAQVIVNGGDRGLASSGNGRWIPEGNGVYHAQVPWTGDSEKALLTWVSRASGGLLAAHYTREKFDEGARGDDKTWRSGETVYIKLKNGQDPNLVPLYIGTSDGVFRIENSSHITIRNLHIRGGGFAGIYMKDANYSGLVLEGLTVTNCFRGFSTDDEQDSGRGLTIRHNLIRNDWPADWRWDGYNDSGSSSDELVAPMRGHGMVMKASDSEISYNEISGGWDGMQVQGHNIMIHHNRIHNMKDDGIELESNNTKNLQLYENEFYDNFVGFSIVSDTPGPIYIYRNIFSGNKLSLFKPQSGEAYRYGYSIKNGGDWGAGARNIKVYHNTFYDKRNNLFDRDKTYDWNDFEYYNNIFYSIGIRDERGTTEAAQMSSNEKYSQGNRFDGNLYYSQKSTRLYSDWNGLGPCSTLADCRELSPVYERSGIQADPRFAWLDEADGAYNSLELAEDSPARDGGVSFPMDWGWPDSVAVTDGRPDIGRYELAPRQGGDQQPPAAPSGLAADEASSYSVGLSWEENSEEDLKGYNLYRGTEPDFVADSYSRLATWLTGAAYRDRLELEPGTAYYYKATAVDQSGNESAPSSPVMALPPVDDTSPEAPGALIAGTGSEGSILLDWLDSPEEDFSHYRVYRGQEADFIPEEANLLAGGLKASGYRDISATVGQIYHYKITAVDHLGLESEPAYVVQAAVPDEFKKRLLLIVLSQAMTSGDESLLQRLETLGFQVTVIPHNNLAGNEGEGFDMIYFSSSVYESRINDLFNHTAVPFAITDYGLFDNMKLVERSSNGKSLDRQTSLLIADSQSPLAAGMEGLVQTVYEPLAFAAALMPSGAMTAAVVPEDPQWSLTAGYEKGAIMADGLQAPGRRLVSWQLEPVFTRLTAAGWRLFDAGVGWLAGEIPPSPADIRAIPLPGGKLELSWDEVPDNTGIDSYIVYHNGQLLIGQIPQLHAGRLCLEVAAAEGMSHDFIIRALDTEGNASPQGIFVYRAEAE